MRKLAACGGVFLALVVVAGIPERAHAGGLFYAGSGARPLGRGAAFHVRADDPMALLYNPARLADLDGTQFLANLNLALLDACVSPDGAADIGGSSMSDANNPTAAKRDRGTYRENTDPSQSGAKDVTRYGVIPSGTNPVFRRSWLGATMPKVCNDTALLPLPNFVLTHQLMKPKQGWQPSGTQGLTIAFGMVTPGAVGKTTWGREDGSVRARHATAQEYDRFDNGSENGERLPGGVRPDAVCDPTKQDCSMYCNPDNYDSDAACQAGAQFYCDPNKYDCDSLPTPTRHMLVQQDPFAIPLTLGIGYRPLPWLAIGGAFTYQAVFFKSSVYAVQGQKSVPETDMLIESELKDWFVPIVNVSALVTPMQGIELMGYFKWQSDIEGDSKVKVTDSVDSIGGNVEERAPVSTTIDAGEGVRTIVPQPWEAGAGIRFALPRGGYRKPTQPTTRADPMSDEWFDIEVDYVLEHNSSIDQFTLKSKMNPFDTFQGYDPADTDFNGSPRPQTSTLTFLKEMGLKRNWKNQHVVRVGSDVNVLPGVLTLRAGYNYETRGVDPAYQSVDAFPSKRQGIHGGLTWRITKRLDLSAAYARLFQETITVLHRDAATSDGGALLDDRADLQASSPQEGTVPVNAGTYRVHWDVFSLGITQRF